MKNRPQPPALRSQTHPCLKRTVQFPCRYVHRLGRTGRAGEDGFGISIVGPSETELAASIEEMLAGGSTKAGESGEEEAACEPVMKPYTKLTAVALEGLRYRGTDVARSLTKRTIIEVGLDASVCPLCIS